MKPIKVEVTSRLVVDARELEPEALDAIRQVATHQNPQHFKLKAMGYAAHQEPRTIKTWKGGPGWISLPRGLLSKLREILSEHGCTPQFTDNRTDPNPIAMPKHRVKLYDYQHEAAEAALARENCLIRAPTGSGKTTIAMALIGRVRVPSLVVVWNTALREQWEERVCKEFGLRPSDLGIIQGGKVRLRPITLAMQQSMVRLEEDDRRAICSYFGAVVFDEVHRAAAKTFTEVVDWLPSRYRFGMSADEQRKDGKEFLIYDMFGRVAFEVSRNLLELRNFVLDVELRLHPTGSDLEWYRDQEVPYDRLIAALEQDEARNQLAADIAADEVRAGHQTVVFSQRREHCQRLAAALVERGLQPGLMLGGPESQAELQSSIARLKSGELRIAVGTIQAVGTGIDLPAISRGVLTTPIASNRQLFGQLRGRLCRTAPGKKDAVLHYLYDERAFGQQAIRNLDRWNQTVCVQNGSDRLSVDDYLNVLGHATPTFQSLDFRE